MGHDDYRVVLDRIDHPPRSMEERAIAIANELRKGRPSPELCRVLADMLDPTATAVVPFKLSLTHLKAGRPEANKWLAFLMEKLVDSEGMSTDEAIHSVQKRHGTKGHGRSACLAALTEGREWRSLIRLIE